jgi:TP901 family phage tail tape measure protein
MADGLSSVLGGGIGATIGKAVVQLELDTRKYMAEMKAAQTQTAASTKSMAASLGAIGTVGLAAIGVIGAASIKAAIDFDRSFTRIAAISNTSASAIDEMKESTLALAGETAQAPTELADALFFLSSAGLKAEEIMPALEASAKASAVGLGDTADVANIVASALNAYSGSGLTAAAATDVLVAAVREGRAEPEEFANALGRILPIASTVGVTFDQVAASMAALSNIGLDVNEGVTAMRGVLQAIAAPGSQAAEALNKLGLSSQELLDAISEDGIIGALRLLDKAAKSQTDTQAEYNDALRKVIPNVRSLTGVLGLTVQEASKVDAIFQAVKDSSGALGDAFRTTAESDAFKMQKALNDVVVQATELGKTALPAVVKVLQTLAPIITEVFENLDVLIALFAAFKIASIAAAAGATAFAAALGPIALGIAGAIMLGRQLNDVFYGTDQSVQDLAASLEGTLQPALAAGIITYQQYAAAQEFVREGDFDNAEAALEAQEAIRAAAQAEADRAVFQKSQAAASETYVQGLVNEAVAYGAVGDSAAESGRKFARFAGMGKKALREFKEALVESLQVSAGQFETFNDAFDTTPRELARQLNLAVRIARTAQADLREIFADKSLTDAQKQALAELPANQRHAWAEASDAGKREIEKGAVALARANKTGAQRAADSAKGPAKSGGREVGLALMQGSVTGVIEGSPAVSRAAATAVTNAIDAAKEAAGAESPSKVMHQLGLDMMTGLWQGISTSAQKVIDAEKKAVQKLIDGFKSDLDKIKGLASSFADSIRNAFSGFLDVGGIWSSEMDAFASAQEKYAADQEKFAEDQKKYLEDQAKYLADQANYQLALTKRSGDMPFPTAPTPPTAPTAPTAPGAAPDLSTILQEQLAGARALADVLETLKRQGAGKALLQQVAEQGVAFGQALLQGGPAQIEEANDALKTIAKLAQETGKGLSERFFGDRIERLEKRLEKQNELMKELIAVERLGHDHAIILDGEVVSTTNERGLTRILNRRGSLFDGAVRQR